MPTTTRGYVYPDSLGHDRLWEYYQTLAVGINADVDAIDKKPLTLLRASAAQNLADGADVALNFGGEDLDTHGFHSAAAPSRIIPTKAGYYRFTGTIFMASSTTMTLLTTWVRRNGTTDIGPRSRTKLGSSAGTHSLQVTVTTNANGTTDYFELIGSQTSGGTIATFVGGAFVSYFECEYLRPL